MRVIDARYRLVGEEPIILLLCRDDKKRRMLHVKGFRPYLYVKKEEEVPEHASITEVCEEEKTTIDGQEVKKIFVKMPMDVRSVRSSFSRTWESDILFGWRFRIDLGIKEGIVVDEIKGEYDYREIKGY
jgi:DNA polymerase elongation subunit (family B)